MALPSTSSTITQNKELTRSKEQEIIDWFYSIAKGITEGKERGQLDLKYGNIFFEPEELACLRLTYKEGDPIEFARREILYKRKS